MMLMRSTKFITCCIILLSTLTAHGNDQSFPHLNPDAVILAYGDSLTYGLGTTEEKSYPAILQQLSRRHVVSFGIPGERTAEGLSRLPETLDEYRPQLLILCLGGNDILHRIGQSEIEQNLERMVAVSREHGVPVLLIGVPLPSRRELKTAPLYFDISRKLEVPLEADILPEVLSDRALKSDIIHPNAEGYRLIAEAIYKKLKEDGAL